MFITQINKKLHKKADAFRNYYLTIIEHLSQVYYM